jgi:hypothetical protein
MLQTETQLAHPEALSVSATSKKGSTSTRGSTTVASTNSSITFSSSIIDTMEKSSSDNGKGASTKSAANPFEWEEVKKARNRINSQRIRERERAQIANLEAERARLWLSNDAIRFQNRHFREIMAQIMEIRDLKRSRVMVSGGMGIGGTSAQGTSSALAASLGAAGALGGASSMQMPLSMRHNTDMMGGLGGGLDTAGLLQSSRFSAASVKSLSGLSDADLLARHQATTLEMQNMMRQQEAIDRLGGGGGVGMGGLNMGMNNGMNNNGLNINGMNMNAASVSPYADMAENLRIRQLMLQQSGASGITDFDTRNLLSSLGGGATNQLGNNGGGGNNGGDGNGNGLSFGVGALGDLGNSFGDVDILQMSKRQKFGF